MQVSINSTSEEVLWPNVSLPRIQTIALFPLIPLPKKCCDATAVGAIVWDSAFPLIPLPKKCCDWTTWVQSLASSAVSINSTSEEVLWRRVLGRGLFDASQFPLIPLPKKCCDQVHGGGLFDGNLFPLIPLPKKCCDVWIGFKRLSLLLRFH